MGKFHSLPVAVEPSGTAVDASCVHRPQGSTDSRNDFGEDCRRRKYSEHSEEGSEKFSIWNFRRILTHYPTMGNLTTFRQDGKVVCANEVGSAGYTEPTRENNMNEPNATPQGIR